MTEASLNRRPIKFLLIEDDEDHADLVFRAMHEQNVANNIERIADGEQALRHLRKQPPYEDSVRPDVIILDLNLPRISGHEVLEVVKADPNLASIPVVVLTTSSAERDRERAYKAHVNSYLVKPLDFQKFHELVKELTTYWGTWNTPR
ncbi:MAG: response regulator [Planctomycetota bacterium]